MGRLSGAEERRLNRRLETLNKEVSNLKKQQDIANKEKLKLQEQDKLLNLLEDNGRLREKLGIKKDSVIDKIKSGFFK